MSEYLVAAVLQRAADAAVMHRLHGKDQTAAGYYAAILDKNDAAIASLAGRVPTGIEAEVCADIASRQAIGIKKYGVSVEDNPIELKAWLEHAYLETLDQAIYLKRAIQEMEKP